MVAGAAMETAKTRSQSEAEATSQMIAESLEQAKIPVQRDLVILGDLNVDYKCRFLPNPSFEQEVECDLLDSFAHAAKLEGCSLYNESIV